MENYFNYFTEIEEHFQKRRGKVTLLSPLDWSLIESFQAAGIPLEAVLRGLDQAFEKHEKRRSKTQKVNSLAYCTQAILSEYERQREGSLGKSSQCRTGGGIDSADRENLVRLFEKACGRLKEALVQLQNQNVLLPIKILENARQSLQTIITEVITLERIDFENLEQRLSVLEEKILASLISSISEETLLSLRTTVGQEINRHRRGLKAEQVAMLEKKMMTKKILDQFGIPRLSLFYLPLN
jgi:hypothetical protein